MAPLTAEVERRLARLSAELRQEFPHVPPEAIEQDIKQEAAELAARARFNDFVPVLLHRAVRERLRTAS